MNTTAHQPAAARDLDVIWFDASRRLIGGQPDSRYGWLDTPAGPCVVKALNPGLTAYAGTLLQHERAMLRRLQEIGAPAPQWVDVGRSDWLVTRFAGLSLQRLEHPGGLQGMPPHARFAPPERLAAWVHLLRRLQPMADKGVLAIDLYGANVVLPLTGRTEGQLRLHEAALIDHAHTLEAGMALRRPVWLDRGMDRIAPELREALRLDQEALIAAFKNAGADLPGYSRMPTDKDAFNRRVWAEYDAPQHLQQLLDAGDLSRDRAMQFAAGTAIARLLPAIAPGPQRAALARALQTMTQPEAAQRYTTLCDAADALSEAIGTLPMVSHHAYARLQPADLALPSAAPLAAVAPATSLASAASNDTTHIDIDASASPAMNNHEPTHVTVTAHTVIANATRTLATRWLYVAAGVGAALGFAWPLPW